MSQVSEKKKIPIYGVCDSVEQFVEKFPEFNGIIYLVPVYRSDQPKRDGWRWHKWGPYVGNYNIDHMEYLYEAKGKYGNPKIDVQWLFDLCKPQLIIGLSSPIAKIINNKTINDINTNCISYNQIQLSEEDLNKIANL